MIKKKLELVIPIYYGNYYEIEDSLKKIYDFFKRNMGNYDWKITIGLNGPDKNNIINLCNDLTKKYPKVFLSYNKSPGRGISLSDCWFNSTSDYVSYMDVDIATDLKFFPLMIKELDKNYDVCVGSRYLHNSKKKRSLFRYFISRVYNHFFLKFLLNAKFTDSQCGFKSMNTKIAKEIIPLIKDTNWFWDTEFLYLCQKRGYDLKEIPIVWNEKPNSGVKFAKTIIDFVIKSFELRFRKI